MMLKLLLLIDHIIGCPQSTYSKDEVKEFSRLVKCTLGLLIFFICWLILALAVY